MGCFCLDAEGELFILGDPVMTLNRMEEGKGKGKSRRLRGGMEKEERGVEKRKREVSDEKLMKGTRKETKGGKGRKRQRHEKGRVGKGKSVCVPV